MPEYKIAIVGKPNVGKSALFNRLMSKRVSIVEPTSGVTRDRLYGSIEWMDKSFTIVDTGGIDSGAIGKMSAAISRQVKLAVDESDLLVFVCDGMSGLSSMDKEINRLLKKSGKKTVCVVNKIDNADMAGNIFEFYALGIDDVLGVSAIHGRGIAELLDLITEEVGPSESAGEDLTRKIAVVGRPNVGKSSFVNALLNDERMIVDDVPGTTRDSIDTRFNDGEEDFILIDTAGIRHKRKMKDTVEVFSFARSRRAIARCDAAFVMLDAVNFVTRDDIKVIDMVIEKSKPFVILVNKWDLIKDMQMERYEKALRMRLSYLNYVPVVFTSCVKNRNIKEALKPLKKSMAHSSARCTTHALNEILKDINKARPAQLAGSRLKHMVQTGTNPPEFILFRKGAAKDTDKVRRFVENRLREKLELTGSPIIVHFKKS
ncbi:MAG: ribosome biogenesis GTPase Der [Candidatus Omnitrophica bacterium CG1_02_49_10]|nr:MAG: ribosome biogenesis GTPase Der [Candidatus Omnitrophica bacterium CG1_02_49_10]